MVFSCPSPRVFDYPAVTHPRFVDRPLIPGHAFRTRSHLRTAAGAMKDVLAALVLWVLWQVPVYAFLEMPPRLGVLSLGAVAPFSLWCHALPGGWGTPRGRAAGRVGPIPPRAR